MNAPNYERLRGAYAFAPLQSACAVIILNETEGGTAKISGGLIGGLNLIAAIKQTKYQVFKRVIRFHSPAPDSPLHLPVFLVIRHNGSAISMLSLLHAQCVTLT